MGRYIYSRFYGSVPLRSASICRRWRCYWAQEWTIQFRTWMDWPRLTWQRTVATWTVPTYSETTSLPLCLLSMWDNYSFSYWVLSTPWRFLESNMDVVSFVMDFLVYKMWNFLKFQDEETCMLIMEFKGFHMHNYIILV